MRAIVTGGSGFIGSEVVRRLLAEGNSVRVFSRRSDTASLFAGNVEVATGDLENVRSLIGALDGMDVLYHIGEIKNTSKKAARKNLKVLEMVLRCVKRKKIKRIVFVSSITVAGIPSSVPATEDTPPATVLNDHYTDCKRRSEKLLARGGAGVEYAVIRPGFVYGPGSRHLGTLVNLVNRFGPLGIPFPGNAKSIAPFIHVKDVASAISLAGTEPRASGQTFNLTDGSRHSWLDFLEAIAGSLGKKIRIIPLPRLLLKLTAFPVDILSGLLGLSLDAVSYADYFSRDLYFENAMTRQLLGWQPGYCLEEGVKEMTGFYAGWKV